jgi:aminopeptidase N
VRLADYTPPAFTATHVELLIELFEGEARVTTTSTWIRGAGEGDLLVLDGRGLRTEAVTLDGAEVEIEGIDQGETLTLSPEKDAFSLCVVTLMDPDANTALEGLYRSGGAYCTQMEAEGFRRLTWFTDRPDVLAVYTTTVVADPKTCPVLLGNGNLVESGPADDGRHFATFLDPHPKPCYLFAMVAGDLECLEGSFTTVSGREVALKLWVEHGQSARAGHALESLQRSMRWDEEVYGREYDLDVFHLVAVGDFNMGAMENKGLNIFNSQLVLADPATATDEDYHRIEGVVGHEYFHNWSGNRVTCRDWFQLSLKEGLTVFRDQEFSADMGSAVVQRIADVRQLRELQFGEDAGPQAHPVRPAEYLAIDNFYTTTIYEKGAEVVRMLAALAGPEGYRKGTDLYFERHDGKAVTTDDFVDAIADATGLDLTLFRRWYDQAGTPRLSARGRHDAAAGTYTLELSQSCQPTPGQPLKHPLHIPVAMGLVAPDGSAVPLRLAGESEAPTTRVLSLTDERATWVFEGVAQEPVPSLLRGFSAPVVLDDGLGDEQLAFLAAHDADLFNRWDAGQRLLTRAILARLTGDQGSVGDGWRELPAALLGDPELDPAFAAQALSLPSELELVSQLENADPQALHAARESVALELATTHRGLLLERYDELVASAGSSADARSIGRRALKNACLSLLMRLDEEAIAERCTTQLEAAATMTDEQAALEELANLQGPRRDAAVARFRERWAEDALVMNKWFAAQASARRPQLVDDVVALASDPAFSEDNPNKLRSLYRVFARNMARFHDRSGRGYDLLADVILRMDGRNPVLAGRMASLFGDPRRLHPELATPLRAVLGRIAATEGLSDNTAEIVGRALAE